MSFYISLSQNFTFPIRAAKPDYNPATGDLIGVRKGLVAQFKASTNAPEHALKAVETLPAFGRGIGLNEDPFGRVGTFDTKEAQDEYDWTDEERLYVEGIMDSASGVYFVRADYPALAAPWPNYDSILGDEEEAAERIARKVEEDGYDPRLVLSYERQNLNRETVVAALLILAEPDEEPVSGTVIQA